MIKVGGVIVVVKVVNVVKEKTNNRNWEGGESAHSGKLAPPQSCAGETVNCCM